MTGVVGCLARSPGSEFFTRSEHGTIWGTVYFQIGENQFCPGQGWTDLAAEFVAKVEGLLRKLAEVVYEQDFALQVINL